MVDMLMMSAWVKDQGVMYCILGVVRSQKRWPPPESILVDNLLRTSLRVGSSWM